MTAPNPPGRASSDEQRRSRTEPGGRRVEHELRARTEYLEFGVPVLRRSSERDGDYATALTDLGHSVQSDARLDDRDYSGCDIA